MDWREYYSKRLLTAEEAVKAIKSGDRVTIADAPSLEAALGARAGELGGVKIRGSLFNKDLPWFQPGFENSFTAESWAPPVLWGNVPPDLKVSDYLPPALTFVRARLDDERQLEQGKIDAFMVTLSEPDKNGYCSFGASLVSKKNHARRARVVLAEVSSQPEHCLRTGGDNFIHVSEIDYFVPHVPGSITRRRGLFGQRELTDIDRTIAGNVAELIRDGDTIEIGIGSVAEALPMAGAFSGKRDLGLHSGGAWKGLISLIKEGIFTGARKTVNRGKAVTTGLQLTGGPEDRELLQFVDNNPSFELYSIEYLHDFAVLAAMDNFVAINSVLAIDLAGQMTTESIGAQLVGTPGGFPAFAMGAMLSRGGRSIVVGASTSAGGKVSRIVPSFPAGTMVTLPRYFADYVVTEYGIACLTGKTHRRRIQELIHVAHPDLRRDLERQAEKL